MEDTIVALSTAPGEGAISIIRISGDSAIEICNKIFDRDLNQFLTHTINYGKIYYKDEFIDEVLLSIMKAPKTYTKEDIIEINCHGGVAVSRKIMEILLELGCRMAEPGEFTKRAFLNGRIDLIEAEGIMNMISAKTEISRELASTKLNGKTTKLIKKLREELVQIIGTIAVNIDYPEYDDVEEMNREKLISKIDNIKKELVQIKEESENFHFIKEGISLAIVGKPNVGKSSLLNALLEEDKAIVSSIPGTTRDLVEGKIVLDGIVMNLVDTAGIRRTDNLVEEMGVQKSKKHLKNSDLLIFVLNNGDDLNEEELEILNSIQDQAHIVVVNKDDIHTNKKYPEDYIMVSALYNKGIDKLKNKIREIYNLNDLKNKDLTYIINIESIAKINICLDLIKEIEKDNISGVDIDIIEISIRKIWELLGEIIGESYEEEFLDELFSKFCLGK